MKIVDMVKNDIKDKSCSIESINVCLAQHGYDPLGSYEDGALKYTNGKSTIFVKCVEDGNMYMVNDVTMSNKKRGSTKTRAFREMDEIVAMMNWFRDNDRLDDFMIFVLGLFLARRVGDTISLKWDDFYYENGRRKDYIDNLIEDKTDKIINITISDKTWEYLDWYCEKIDINPMEHLHETVYQTDYKESLFVINSESVESVESKYRRQFKLAADYNGFTRVSTHSTRKTFGHTAHELFRFDPDCLPVLQTVYGHSSMEQTKVYTDIMDEKAERMFQEVSAYISDADHGIMPDIVNSLVIPLKAYDLRDVLYMAIKAGRSTSESNDVDTMNMLLNIAEERRMS